jgi:hypothetical protein
MKQQAFSWLGVIAVTLVLEATPQTGSHELSRPGLWNVSLPFSLPDAPDPEGAQPPTMTTAAAGGGGRLIPAAAHLQGQGTLTVDAIVLLAVFRSGPLQLTV